MGLTPAFWRQRRVFVTGHTGFKGSWLCLWLNQLRASIHGYSLPPETTPSLFEVAEVESVLASHVIGDVRDRDALATALSKAKPDVVIHLAAQSLVRRSYYEPVETITTNVVGTVALLEAVRQSSTVRDVLVITSDKCYANREDPNGYVEDAPLGGTDPYSASKACAELLTSAYRASFVQSTRPAIASARAGNVIGGGDWSEHRLVADAVRAFTSGQALRVRSPASVRPWQHVLDVLDGYLVLLQALDASPEHNAEAWNFGPVPGTGVTVAMLAERLAARWGDEARWVADPPADGPREAAVLQVDPGKARSRLGWRCKLDVSQAVDWAVDWHKAFNRDPKSARRVCEEQIARYLEVA